MSGGGAPSASPAPEGFLTAEVPRPRGAGSTPGEWLDAFIWQSEEAAWHVAQSPWAPVLALVLSALFVLWLVRPSRLERARRAATPRDG